MGAEITYSEVMQGRLRDGVPRLHDDREQQASPGSRAEGP
jgi:hypothetical protein